LPVSISSYCKALLPYAALAFSTAGSAATEAETVQLKLTPRVCTLTQFDEQCEATVRAEWRAPRNESLCLVIVDRPEIKRCWEDHAAGVYSIELVFQQDLVFELRDLELQRVLATRAIAVIREAIRLRPRRRQPWNIFY
jgi:Protein of unknown function (DUF3019)